jgi:hypothetical protein
VPLAPENTLLKFEITRSASVIRHQYLRLNCQTVFTTPLIKHNSLTKNGVDFIDVSFKFPLDLDDSVSGNETYLIVELDSSIYQNDVGYVNLIDL